MRPLLPKHSREHHSSRFRLTGVIILLGVFACIPLLFLYSQRGLKSTMQLHGMVDSPSSNVKLGIRPMAIPDDDDGYDDDDDDHVNKQNDDDDQSDDQSEITPSPKPTYPTESKFKFDLTMRQPDYAVSGGTIRTAHSGTFPFLQGMGMYLVELKPGGLRIPHWHPICNELNYVISGTALMGVGTPATAALGTSEEHEVFTVMEGQIAFIPRGWLHYIKNIGDKDLTVLVVFDSNKPDDIGFSQGFGAVRKEVLAETFGQNSSVFESFNEKAALIVPQ